MATKRIFGRSDPDPEPEDDDKDKVVADEAAAQARYEATPDPLADPPPADQPDPPPGGPFGLGDGATPDPLLAANARTWRDRITPGESIHASKFSD